MLRKLLIGLGVLTALVLLAVAALFLFVDVNAFKPRIEQVRVQITDVVRDTTSSQKLCRLSVRMKRLGSFSVDSVEEQLANAVSRAAN